MLNTLFSAKMGQEIRPMNKLSDKRIEGLLTHGKVGWGGGKKFFPPRCNRRDGERKRERTRNACFFIRTLPLGDRNDWLLKERLD